MYKTAAIAGHTHHDTITENVLRNTVQIGKKVIKIYKNSMFSTRKIAGCAGSELNCSRSQ